ncbi:MAG: hypothetical protein WBP55_12410 [Solirubrobacterales bacterium]
MGNPLTSEVAAFRWLVAILLGAGSVALASALFGSIVAIWYGLALIFILIGFIAKGMMYMLSSPDGDEPDGDEPDGDSGAGSAAGTSGDAVEPGKLAAGDDVLEDPSD